MLPLFNVAQDEEYLLRAKRDKHGLPPDVPYNRNEFGVKQTL